MPVACTPRHRLAFTHLVKREFSGISELLHHPEVPRGSRPFRTSTDPDILDDTLQTPETAGGGGSGLWYEGSDGGMRIWEPSATQLEAEAEASSPNGSCSTVGHTCLRTLGQLVMVSRIDTWCEPTLTRSRVSGTFTATLTEG